MLFKEKRGLFMAEKTMAEIKVSIDSILNSATPIKNVEHIPTNDSEFTYENGIRASISALFVDIVDSSALFKNGRDVKLAKIIRAFVQESIDIMRNNSHYREIGIRGDCVYAIFDTPSPADCKDVFVTSYRLNSFLQLLEKQVFAKFQIKITAGIGIGFDPQSLIIKTGKSRSGFSDNVWLGNAVVDAANLSGISNRNGRKKIAMSEAFYDKAKNEILKINSIKGEWFNSVRRDDLIFYETNIYQSF